MTAGYVIDIEKEAERNEFFRKVLYTADKSQVVVMSLGPGEEIGLEVHDGDQILCIVEGAGVAVVGGVEHKISEDSLVFVPAGVNHNVINGKKEAMKLFTVYAPPQHRAGTVHRTKSEAEASEHQEAWKR